MQRGLKGAAKAAWLLLTALAGCNAVLGIEEAHLSDGPPQNSSTANPVSYAAITTCDSPAPECEDCMTGVCSSFLQQAMLTPTNRMALNDYRACLGARCEDTQSFGCLEAMKERHTDLFVLGTCVEMNCPNCKGRPLVPTRALYCQCMSQHCGQGVQNDLGGDCDANATTNLEDLSCRHKHCENAPLDFAAHCAHALGQQGMCPPPTVANSCETAGKTGWFCSENSECCSRDCQNRSCR
jgi:hypothetical protein